MASATIQFLIQPQLTGLAQHYGEGLDSIYSLHIGDIRTIGPFTMEPTYNSLNGSTGFPRKSAWFRVTDIPDAVAEKIKKRWKAQTHILTVDTSTILDNLGGGVYRVTEDPVTSLERICRYMILKDKLISEIPAATDTIIHMFDETRLHPDPIPVVTWDKVKNCFFDKWADRAATAAEMEAE